MTAKRILTWSGWGLVFSVSLLALVFGDTQVKDVAEKGLILGAIMLVVGALISAKGAVTEMLRGRKK